MYAGLNRERHFTVLLTLFFAALVYGAISLPNHYFLRTNSMDLGVYTNALYDYAHFRWNDSLVFRSYPENLLADHFDLYLPLFSQLIWLFGTYTLLVIQVVALQVGGLGVYRLLNCWCEPGSRMPLIGMITFLLYFPLFGALAFDYHSSVVAAMFIPWFLLAVEKRKYRQMWLLLIVILIAKENMSLWLLFVTLGLAIKYRKDRHLRSLLLVLSLFCAVYFVTITSFVMPGLSNNHSFHTFPYRSIGKSPLEVVSVLFHHPGRIFRLLFINTSGQPELDYVKAELWIFVSLTGFLLLRKPYYLLMLVPVFAQKLFSDNHVMWGVTAHYSIELAPIIVIGSFDVIMHQSRKITAKWLAATVLLLSAASTIRLMDNTFAWEYPSKLRFYQRAHYRSEMTLKKAHELMERIPPEVAVSAENHFVPHLSLRNRMYTFPSIRDAEYILLNPPGDYSAKDQTFRYKCDSLLKSSDWEPIFKDEEFVLLKRKT